MTRKVTWGDKRLGPIERGLVRLILRELDARKDPALTFLARNALLIERTPQMGKTRPSKQVPFSGESTYEPANVEVSLRAERWQRLWAYLAGEDVQPMGEFQTEETTLVFEVAWRLGIPRAKETRRATRPTSQIDDTVSRSTRFVLAVGRDAADYQKTKQEFYRCIGEAFAKMEKQAADALRKAERVQLLDQAETLAAYLLHMRLKAERSPKVWPMIARALWPAPYEAIEQLRQNPRGLSRIGLADEREKLRRQADGLERKAKRRVEAARALVAGGWRQLFVPIPVASPPPDANA